MIRVQLDLLVNVDDHQLVSNYITDALDTIAVNLGDISLQQWAINPVPLFTPVYDGGTPHGGKHG